LLSAAAATFIVKPLGNISGNSTSEPFSGLASRSNCDTLA
jgi:hypothetical protein